MNKKHLVLILALLNGGNAYAAEEHCESNQGGTTSPSGKHSELWEASAWSTGDFTSTDYEGNVSGSTYSKGELAFIISGTNAAGNTFNKYTAYANRTRVDGDQSTTPVFLLTFNCEIIEKCADQADSTFNGIYPASSGFVCVNGCEAHRTTDYNLWEYFDSNGVSEGKFIEGEFTYLPSQCDVSSEGPSSGSTQQAGNPTSDDGQECTGNWYTNASGGISCGSPDDGGGGDTDPVTPDNSCISDPASCTDTDGDGTPDTPTACTATGSNCTDTNGDGVPDTPSGGGDPSGETGGDGDSGLGGDSSTCSGGANSDGSCNGDGDQNTVPDGNGSECRPETMTYDGVCPSGSPDDDCPSNQYTLVNGVSVCNDHGNSGGEGGGTRTTSGGESCNSEPECSGDPIDCANITQTWRLRCDAELPTESELHEAAGTTDITTGDLYGDDIFDLSEGFDKSGFIAGGACPASYTVEAFGNSIPIDLSIFCQIAEYIGVFVLIAGALHSTAIVIKVF